MSVPAIDEQDLAILSNVFPNLDFTDDDCRSVLLENGKVDVQAAPGSGKTTVLAARLYLLGRKWKSERQGICVISHTNTASREIRLRLAGTVEGNRLLGHPHFIGTIHAFVNQYLALPSLRSVGTSVDGIDDELFERRAWKEAWKNSVLSFWMRRQPNAAPAIVAGLRYMGENLVLTSAGGKVPDSGPVSDALKSLKEKLHTAGVFRYEDMFAFAENAMRDRPRMKQLLSRRFPLVMIDEMQDTSVAQAALLRRIFTDEVIVQRFGDINQRIFDGKGDGDILFPEGHCLSMSASRRFGPVIAGIVSAVRESGPEVVGKGASSSIPPTLLVYESAKVDHVIPHFGRLVLEAFDDATLEGGGHVRAICARRSGEADQAPGRHVADFWPPFAVETTHSARKLTNAWVMLGKDIDMGTAPFELGERVERVRRIILLALRQANAPVAVDIREPWRLFRTLRDADFDLQRIRLACRSLVLDKTAGKTHEGRAAVINTLHDALTPLLSGKSLDEFSRLDVFSAPDNEEDSAPISESCTCRVAHGGRTVVVSIDTVAMTKGETHLATLYLESFGWPSGRFDLVEAIGLITGSFDAKRKAPPSVKPQLRSVYVGLSRPAQFLCLAINSERLANEDSVALRAEGWRVVNVT